MLKRMIALLTVICMMAVMFVACSDPSDKTPEATKGGTGNNNPSESSNSLFKPIKDSLPELNFDGEVINVVLRSDERYSGEFMVDENDTNAVSSAIFKRNTMVQERFDVDIEFYPIGNGHGPWSDIENSIFTGTCKYDIVVGSSSPASAQFQKGLYRNLRNIDYIDFSKEYWSQGIIDNQTIAGATYGITGSISTYFYDSAFVIYFNRDLCIANDIDPDEVYGLVMDGKWTLEEMMTMTKDIWIDDGDGTPDEGDVFGFGLQVTSATDGFTSSCLVDYINESETGIEIAMDLAKVSDIVDKLNSFLWDNEGVCGLVEGAGYVANDLYLFDKQFASDKLLFVTDWLYSTSTVTMRDMTSDFGVLPYPKYTVDQEYSTYVHDKYSLFSIPVSVSNDRVDMVGAVLEAMASEGHNTVMPAYYEKALTSRYIRDPESVQTMDIIVRNIFIDKLWSLDNRIPRYTLRYPVWNHTTDVASSYREYYDLSKSTLSDIFTLYAKYAEN